MPAEQRYTAPLFKVSLAYARQLAPDGNIFVLSAMHGLIPLTQRIGPRDVTLHDMSATERAAWGEHVVAQMRDKLGSGRREIVLLTGQLYADALRDAKGTAEWTFAEPMRGMGIGSRMHHLLGRAGGDER
jgi:hypothetical protein